MGLINRSVIFNVKQLMRGDYVYGRWKEKIPI